MSRWGHGSSVSYRSTAAVSVRTVSIFFSGIIKFLHPLFYTFLRFHILVPFSCFSIPSSLSLPSFYYSFPFGPFPIPIINHPQISPPLYLSSPCFLLPPHPLLACDYHAERYHIITTDSNQSYCIHCWLIYSQYCTAQNSFQSQNPPLKVNAPAVSTWQRVISRKSWIIPPEGRSQLKE